MMRYFKNIWLGFTAFILIANSTILGKTEAETMSFFRQYKTEIESTAEMLGIPAYFFICSLYPEIRYNYNGLDQSMDILLAKTGHDSSIGVCQIKLSTARWISGVARNKDNPYYIKVSDHYFHIVSVSLPQETLAILINPIQSIRTAQLLIAMNYYRWLKAGIDLKDKVGVLATLYNAGSIDRNGVERAPGRHPKMNRYGELAMQFFDSDSLLSLTTK